MGKVTECMIYIANYKVHILVYHLKLGDIKLNARGCLILRISALGADGGTLFPP
jgi:hypothetical protein